MPIKDMTPKQMREQLWEDAMNMLLSRSLFLNGYGLLDKPSNQLSIIEKVGRIADYVLQHASDDEITNIWDAGINLADAIDNYLPHVAYVDRSMIGHYDAFSRLAKSLTGVSWMYVELWYVNILRNHPDEDVDTVFTSFVKKNYSKAMATEILAE